LESRSARRPETKPGTGGAVGAGAGAGAYAAAGASLLEKKLKPLAAGTTGAAGTGSGATGATGTGAGATCGVGGTSVVEGAGSTRGGMEITAPHFRHRIFAPCGGMMLSSIE